MVSFEERVEIASALRSIDPSGGPVWHDLSIVAALRSAANTIRNAERAKAAAEKHDATPFPNPKGPMRAAHVLWCHENGYVPTLIRGGTVGSVVLGPITRGSTGPNSEFGFLTRSESAEFGPLSMIVCSEKSRIGIRMATRDYPAMCEMYGDQFELAPAIVSKADTIVLFSTDRTIVPGPFGDLAEVIDLKTESILFPPSFDTHVGSRVHWSHELRTIDGPPHPTLLAALKAAGRIR